jgi:hypothetical protein
MTRLAVIVLVLAAALACSTSVEEGSASFINANCPGMGEAVDPEVASYDWDGKQVGFCCDGCIEDFAALSDDEKAAALQKVGTDL